MNTTEEQYFGEWAEYNYEERQPLNPEAGRPEKIPAVMCRFCGHDGYYVKTKMEGIGVTHFRFDGGETDNSQMHDCLKYTHYKTMSCSNCHKKLGNKNVT